MELKLLIAGVCIFFLSRIMKYYKNKIRKPVIQKIYNEIYEWVETGWSAVLLAAFLMYFFIQAFKIPTGSMRMTLLEGDHLFVNKFIYGFHMPFSDGKRFWPLNEVKRGDIIVFKCPPSALTVSEREDKISKDFVKRCIAVGGETIEIKNKKVYVNGKLLDEPYAKFNDDTVFKPIQIFVSTEQYQQTWQAGRFAELPPSLIRDNFGPVTIPKGYYFAMGDNRDHSFDSRFWGPVPDNNLKGRPLFIYWPPKRLKLFR